MTRAAASVFAYAIYLFVLGAILLLDPNHLLGLFGFPATSEPWIRVVGMTAVIIGYYYLNAARTGLEPFMRWTVNARCTVLLFFMAFVLMGVARPQLIFFGLIEVAGALWTLFALRADAARRLAT